MYYLADFSKTKNRDEKRQNRNKELRKWGGATLTAAGTGLATYPTITGGLVYGISGKPKQAVKSAFDVGRTTLKHPLQALNPKNPGGKVALGSLLTYGSYRAGKAIVNKLRPKKEVKK